MSNLFQAILNFFRNLFQKASKAPQSIPTLTQAITLPTQSKELVQEAVMKPLEDYAPPYGTQMKDILNEREYKAYLAKYKEFPPIGTSGTAPNLNTGTISTTGEETLAQAAQRRGLDSVQLSNLLFVAYTLKGTTNDEKIDEYLAQINPPGYQAQWDKYTYDKAKQYGRVDTAPEGSGGATVGEGGVNPAPTPQEYLTPTPEVFRNFQFDNPETPEEKLFNQIMRNEGFSAAYSYAMSHWNDINLRKGLITKGASPDDVSRIINQASNQGKYFSDLVPTNTRRGKKPPKPPVGETEVGNAAQTYDTGA